MDGYQTKSKEVQLSIYLSYHPHQNKYLITNNTSKTVRMNPFQEKDQNIFEHQEIKQLKQVKDDLQFQFENIQSRSAKLTIQQKTQEKQILDLEAAIQKSQNYLYKSQADYNSNDIYSQKIQYVLPYNHPIFCQSSQNIEKLQSDVSSIQSEIQLTLPKLSMIQKQTTETDSLIECESKELQNLQNSINQIEQELVELTNIELDQLDGLNREIEQQKLEKEKNMKEKGQLLSIISQIDEGIILLDLDFEKSLIHLESHLNQLIEDNEQQQKIKGIMMINCLIRKFLSRKLKKHFLRLNMRYLNSYKRGFEFLKIILKQLKRQRKQNHFNELIKLILNPNQQWRISSNSEHQVDNLKNQIKAQFNSRKEQSKRHKIMLMVFNFNECKQKILKESVYQLKLNLKQFQNLKKLKQVFIKTQVKFDSYHFISKKRYFFDQWRNAITELKQNENENEYIQQKTEFKLKFKVMGQLQQINNKNIEQHLLETLQQKSYTFNFIQELKQKFIALSFINNFIENKKEQVRSQNFLFLKKVLIEMESIQLLKCYKDQKEQGAILAQKIECLEEQLQYQNGNIFEKCVSNFEQRVKRQSIQIWQQQIKRFDEFRIRVFMMNYLINKKIREKTIKRWKQKSYELKQIEKVEIIQKIQDYRNENEENIQYLEEVREDNESQIWNIKIRLLGNSLRITMIKQLNFGFSGLIEFKIKKKKQETSVVLIKGMVNRMAKRIKSETFNQIDFHGQVRMYKQIFDQNQAYFLEIIREKMQDKRYKQLIDLFNKSH